MPGEDEEGSVPQGTTGSLAELSASFWDSDEQKLLPGTPRDELRSLKFIYRDPSGVGREWLWCGG